MDFQLIKRLPITHPSKRLLAALIVEGEKGIEEFGIVDAFLCLDVNKAHETAKLEFLLGYWALDELYNNNLVYHVDGSDRKVNVSVKNVLKWIYDSLSDDNPDDVLIQDQLAELLHKINALE